MDPLAMTDLLEAFVHGTRWEGELVLANGVLCAILRSPQLLKPALQPPEPEPLTPEPRTPDLRAIEYHFNLPLRCAAVALGLCVTRLKLLCRKLGIRKWPYRTIASLKRVDGALAAELVARGPPYKTSRPEKGVVSRACKNRYLMRLRRR